MTVARNWTDNQRSAISAHGGSVIVSAAAGSGKTAVLVERVIRIITDEQRSIRADRLLVVTYTRAAAAELRERLSAALSERIAADPTNRFLLSQQTLLSKAHISTVDSFCSSLVKEYFYLLDIDRNFRIADDSELSLVRDDALKLTLDALYTEGDPGFLSLVEMFASARDDRVLCENILHIYDFLRSHPFPKRWMKEKLAYYTDFSDVAGSVWGRLILSYTAEAVEYLNELLEESVMTIALDEALHKSLSPLFERDAMFLSVLTDALKAHRWDDIAAAVRSFDRGRFTAPRGYKENPLKLTAEANRKTFKSAVETLQSLYSQDELECLYDIELLHGMTGQMFRSVELFAENYAALKAQRRLADYPDLEHWTLRLLIDPDTMIPTPLSQEIAARFDEVMVDEYQDANEIQDTIFGILSGGGRRLFVVGDVKQSIYGFRQAMPELFLKRKNNATLYREDHPVFPANIILEKNFRSESELLSGINFFFRKLMSPDVGGIRYDEAEQLYPGMDYAPAAEPPIEFAVVDRESAPDDEAAVTEARYIAERIYRMIASAYPIKDGDGYRPAELGDFAVLMRTKKNIPIVVDILSTVGLRAFAESSHGFLGAHEIMVMTNFLRVINNPALDIELLSVMLSPVFAFTEDDLVRIRLRSRRSSLFAAVTLDAKAGQEKSRRFLDELSYYRTLSVTVSLTRLISHIYERSSFLSVFCASAESDIPQKNLRLLLEYAGSFEQNTHRGLSAFVSYLDRLSANGTDLPAASGAGDRMHNGVQVMSIHSSKGLEFPVVFIAGMATRFNSDTKENVLLHPVYGFALKRRDIALKAQYNTMPRKALALEIGRTEMSEELRILYVAMTRARQKLILTAAPLRAASFLEHNAARVRSGDICPFAVRSVSSPADWAAMCMLTHPDADALRAAVSSVCATDSSSGCRMIGGIVGVEISPDGVTAAADTVIAPDESVITELTRHDGFVYPYEGMLGLPVKVAASELAHKTSAVDFERILSSPAFLSEKKLTSADRGTALHAFMQYTDFVAARQSIEHEITRLVQSGYLSALQGESIDRDRAAAFVRSPLIDRVLRSQQVYKEYRFTVRIPAVTVSPDIDQRFYEEPVVLQGAVDLAFVEDGALVVVDYKTDRVRSADRLVGMYASQLTLYRRALEACLGLPVKECLIYSVHLTQEIAIDGYLYPPERA